ncbi:lysylphosphatidylglycerol synthase transmembrane domain-containing protein [Candidatus Leptofilum sp.]|uniref:lysylphosphatidylglycerol synthase transmembrane domain-containing protein n=1 Tax=Candidatus Leptofilum sp. TaxID=3241576 RepID=UPI003B5AEBFB
MKKRFGKAFIWGVALLVLWLVVRSVPLREVGRTLALLQGWQLVVLLFLNGLVLLGLNGRWWLLLRGLGYKLPFGSLLGHRLAAFGVSYFTPGPHFGGEPVQVLLVERQHGVPRAGAIAAVSLDKTVELLLNFGFLVFGVALVVQTGLLGGAVGGQTAVWVLLLLLPPMLYLWRIWLGGQPITKLLRIVKLERWVTAVSASEIQMNTLCQQNPGALLGAIGISVLSWGLMIIEFYAMATFLGVSLSLVQLIALLTAARLAYLLPLPGGLGTLEASQVWALGLMGFNPAAGLGLSLLIRLRDVLLGLLGLWWMGRRLKMVWIRP